MTVSRLAERQADQPDARGGATTEPGPRLALTHALVAVSSLGVAAMALADAFSRAGRPGAYGLFWVGIAVIVAPVIVGVTRPAVSHGECLLLVGALAVEMYAAKIVYAPTRFLLSDEFAHLRTAVDIQRTHHLFSTNPVIFVSPNYPGLEGVTASVSSATGMSLFHAGLLVVGLGRVVGLLSLYLLLERVTSSPRAAAAGVLVYVGNPNYLYWSAQFAYESLALPLATLTLCLLTLPQAKRARSWVTATAVVVGLAVVPTHHLTSYVLIVLLLAWAVAASVRRSPGAGSVAVTAGVVMAAAIGWFAAVASRTTEYIGPVLGRAWTHALEVISGHRQARGLYVAQTGLVSPLWERALGIAAVLGLLVGIVLGIRRLRHRTSPLGAVLFGLAVAYPITLPLRFVPDGQEVANRTSEFVFLGLALVVGAAATALRAQRSARAAHVASAASVLVVVLGGITASWAYYLRTTPAATPVTTPLVVGDDHVATAMWARSALGTQKRFVSDVVTRNALAAYGDEHTVTAASDRVRIWSIFFEPRFDAKVVQGLRNAQIDYVVIDRRLVHGIPPTTGIYFDSGEPPANVPAAPMTERTLGKFDGVDGVARIFDSGNLQIYDVRTLTARPMP
jgi:hypothetical protein